jgi:diguanylate cyclase (GGDEF)-like protein
MLISSILLMQDVQLLCFTVIFGVLALQRWRDATWRWLWYSFLANAAGAFCDFTGPHLPLWINQGINVELIPLSYALLNVSLMYFSRLSRRVVWISGIILLIFLPFFLLGSHAPNQVRNLALGDFAIALESLVTAIILLQGTEKPTRSPRYLMSGFLFVFVLIELARAGAAFLLHGDPDMIYAQKLGLASAVVYVVNTSILPLAFVWMMNARLEADLLQQSIVDPLTHVLNRRGLEQALERELTRYRRYGNELTVAMIDLDHFKKLNDAYGHGAGDVVLTGVATLLGNLLRETDVVSRLGGEEFVLLLPHTDIAESQPVLENLCRALRERTDMLPHATVNVTASFGASTTRGRRSITGIELLREADVALYRAKEDGRAQVRFFTSADETRDVLQHSFRIYRGGLGQDDKRS